MDNYIRLCRLNHTYSSYTQPYFATEAARDAAFQEDYIEVNSRNPSIYIEKHNEITLVVDCDYTIARDYNAVELQYNDKRYFCYVMDTELVSVGRTKLTCFISPLLNYCGFSNKLENCTVTKRTFADFSNDFIIAVKNQVITLPNNAFKISDITDISLDTVMQIRSIEYAVTNETKCSIDAGNLAYLDCLCLFTTTPIFNGNSGYALGKIKTGYYCTLIPFNTTASYKNVPLVIHHQIVDLYVSYSSNVGWLGAHDYFEEAKNKLLAEFSPYIISMQVVRFPIIYKSIKVAQAASILGYYLPINGIISDYYYTDSSGESKFVLNLINVESSILWDKKVNALYKPYSLVVNTSDNSLINASLRILITYNSSYDIPFSYFYYGSFYLNIDIGILISTGGTDISLQITSPNEYGTFISDSFYGFDYCFTLGNSIQYVIDSESAFYAENQYYDALTRESVNYTKVSGTLSGITQLGSGLMQLATLPLAGVSALSQGGSYLLRGVESIGQGMLEANHIQEERELQKQNEINKPDTPSSVSSYYHDMLEFNGFPYLQVIQQTDKQYNDFLTKMHFYGLECSLKVSAGEDIFTGFWTESIGFLQCIFTSIEGVYNPEDLEELQQLLRNGVQLKYYA